MNIMWKAAEIRDENGIEYEHRMGNVVHLNTPHARAHAERNARYSAQLLEQDREDTRESEIAAELEELYAERQRIEMRIFDLERERDQRRGGSRG
jgi:hypothetical protein